MYIVTNTRVLTPWKIKLKGKILSHKHDFIILAFTHLIINES